jgi:hypothetical protein
LYCSQPATYHKSTCSVSKTRFSFSISFLIWKERIKILLKKTCGGTIFLLQMTTKKISSHFKKVECYVVEI